MLGSRTFWTIAAAGFLTALAACDATSDRAPSIGTAFAGPAVLNLRKAIDAKSAIVTSVHHGEKLDIVGQRRRWYKVRTAKGIEGWTSDRELLDTGQMQRLRSLAGESADMPSQGVATTFTDLNVHTEPSRQSPSFIQVKVHEKVDVIAHRVVRRASLPKRELVPPKPKLRKKVDKKNQGKQGRVPPPPAPEPPAPPSDWLQLSPSHEPPPEPVETAPVPSDDWTLIRTASGQSGWVLTSALYLAIPDEVAQYAEGHRITSYFSLGKIQDGGEQKDIWLWTTSERLGEDHDFDSYRVFVWSLRHHRYETAYIQRRERGFFPVLAKTGEFSVCLEGDDNSRMRKQYVMEGNAVHLSGEQPCAKTAVQDDSPRELVNPAAPRQTAVKKSFVNRLKDKVKQLFPK